MNIKRILLSSLVAIVCAITGYIGMRISGEENAVAQETQEVHTFWNASTVEEASEIAGYTIALPSVMPTEFNLDSKVMVSEVGLQENVHRITHMVWTRDGDRSTYLMLMQSPRYFELGNSELVEVAGIQCQRSFMDATTKNPAKVTFAWEKDGMYFALTGILNKGISEDELQAIASSISIQ